MPRRRRVLYKLLFFIVYSFIFIGELTQEVALTPVKLAVAVKRGITYALKSLANSLKKIKFKKIRLIKPAWRLPKFAIKVKLPKLKLPKLPKIKKVRARPRISSFRLKYFVIGFLTALIIVSVYQTYSFAKSLPSPRSIGKVNFSLSTHLFDRKGKELYEFYREQNRTSVKLAELPAYVYQASIAIEDKDFFKHNGISPIGGMIRALREDFLNKQLQGGSTITQQLVKSALLTPEKTIQRKIKEIILALWTERLFTKQQILEMYLNQVPYGGAAYGIEEASKIYFNKHARDLSLDEAAFLAGLPQAPSVYSPYVNPDLSHRRRNEVLLKMYQQGYISKNDYDIAVKAPLDVSSPKTAIKAPHFVFYVKDFLTQEFGIHAVEEGGLKVTTTLDLDIQEKAEQILTDELTKIKALDVGNGAILVTRPSTGEILSMVGSVDYFATPSGAFNVTTALRQPGSSIKPLMYSFALGHGFTAASIIDDSPVTFSSSGGPSYSPVNYDGRYHGKMPLRFALANSYNVPAVKVLNSIGVDNFVNQARLLGITTWNDSSRFGLSLTLGGGEVQMTDMATAFGVFANGGKKVNISPIVRVNNDLDDTIYNGKLQAGQVLDPGIAYIISDILSDNQARLTAFGPYSSLEIKGHKVSVKTGTTDSKKDNWTIGYTPDFLVAVWVGNNDNTPMNPQLTSGITGAAPIWNRVMTYLLNEYEQKDSWLTKPSDIAEKKCYNGRIEYFIKGTENTATCGGVSFLSPSPTQKPN